MSQIRRRQPTSSLIHLVDRQVLAIVQRPISDGGWLTTYEDVTERKRVESKIVFLAHHDPLTELPNRAMFNERLNEALGSRGGVAILSLDLDRFKDVNDTLGHSFGDALLKAVSTRVLGCVRTGDSVGRLGGDEFAVILWPMHDLSDATGMAERILETVSRPYDLSGEHITIGVSVGIAIADLGATDADTLLKQADLALYRAKTEGRGAYRVFEPAMHAHLRERLLLETDMRKALAQEEFELFYQPLVNVRSGLVRGFEALLRWRHPTRGLVGAAELVPVAEAP